MESNPSPSLRMLAQDVVQQVDGMSAMDVTCLLREVQRLLEQKAWNPCAVEESIEAEIQRSYGPTAGDS